jgi:peptide/nickel transport system substrate-binding protein
LRQPRNAAPAIRDRATIGMQLEPPVLDPTANPAAAISEILYGNVYEGLVQFAATDRRCRSSPNPGRSRPTVSPMCFICAAACASPTAAPFDAAVAKFSLERAIAPDSVNPQKPRLAAIAPIEALDPHTLAHLAHRAAPAGLLQSLAWGAFVMVVAADRRGQCAASGRHRSVRFSDWRRGDSLESGPQSRLLGQRAAAARGDLQVHRRSRRRPTRR